MKFSDADDPEPEGIPARYYAPPLGGDIKQ